MGKRGAQRPPKPPGKRPGAGKGKAGGAKRKARPFPVHEHLGEHLKALYDHVIDEPIPDRFRQLLDQLEHKPSQATAKAPVEPPHKAK